MCWGTILRYLRTGLGSTSVVLNGDGTVDSEARYYPYGVTRWSSGTLPTDYRFTGQREDAYIKLTIMGARWYDGQLGRWISPDTIIPDPANPQSFNRYSYVGNRPLNRTDLSGHQEVVPELMQQAIDYFTGIGWELVGDASQINPNWNGPDLVFFSSQDGRVLAVELKDVANNVNLGTLGKSPVSGTYGGSMGRLASSTERFYNSSKDQLRLMCRTVYDAIAAGKAENAIFTSAPKISEGAQGQFEGAYRVAQNGQIISDKALEEVRRPSFWTKVGAAASSAWHGLKAWGTQLTTSLASTEVVLPFFYLPYGAVEQMLQPYGYYEVQN
jgi:RHS repeat-associated protein